MATSLKKFMQQLSGKKAPGPSTSFTIFHVFYALQLLSKKPIGRNKLAEQLNVGDGAIRTIISRLREADLITASKAGCELTEKGKNIWRQFEEIFPREIDFGKSELNPNEYNYAFLVKNCGEKVGSGINQRDAAIIAGARKAFVMVYRNGRLRIESVVDDMEKQYPKTTKQMIEQLQPQENDAIVVASAESVLRAKRGAFAASWSLISA
ncbi:MAG: winged helix-turn-helix domain-containing protein [Candidatus Bathyarchaeota archaeon]|nr:winged helix-turn-helix domain-containing protein [Candidatus Bathyarchaeota archaeon]